LVGEPMGWEVGGVGVPQARVARIIANWGRAIRFIAVCYFPANARIAKKSQMPTSPKTSLMMAVARERCLPN